MVQSSSLLICEAVLKEKSGVVSAIRIMDVLTIPALGTHAHFFVLTYLHSMPSDFHQHTLKIQMVEQSGVDWDVIADAPEHKFVYGYAAAPDGPGSFHFDY